LRKNPRARVVGFSACPWHSLSNNGKPLAKNQNTYEKHRREAEKKRKAEDKRRDKRVRKDTNNAPELPPAPPPAAE